MGRYFFPRFCELLLVVFLGITLIFFVIHLAPGNPAMHFLNPNSSPEIQQRAIERFGLNQPLVVQYLSWLDQVILHGNFGNSFMTGQPATELVRAALPPTLLLTGFALLIAIILGILSGINSAYRQNSVGDRLTTGLMFFFYSMPAFWLGLILLGIFAVKLHWLPTAQIVSLFHDQFDFGQKIGDYARHLFLPVVTLGLSLAAVFYRYMRASLIDVLHSEYITAARARGLSERKILFSYALRNALLPQIGLIGMSVPLLFSGAVVVEVVFSLPGMGRVMAEAVMSRDYPVILAASTLAFGAVALGNFLADWVSLLANPRIRE